MQGRTLTPRSLDDPVRLATELFATLDLSPTSIAVARLAAETAGARTARLFLLTDGTPRLLAQVTGGEPSGRETRARLPRGQSHAIRAAAALPAAGWQTELGAMVLPLRAGDRVIAAVLLDGGDAEHASPADLAALTQVATVAGIALENALVHRDIHQRAERLADLERAKSQFLNLASHELRGPLTVLMGYLSLLEDGAFGEVPAELSRMLPTINARIVEMDALINAMLETARLEDDRLELLLTDQDLADVAEESLGRAEAFVKPGQRVILERPPERVPVTVDRGRMVLAIGNLLHNAVKYSVDGTDVTCAVRVDGDDALVAVVDSGIGIAAADLRTLFTRFGRVRTDPAVRSIPGTGLGLYLARELTRAHGGDIAVESTPGQGSTFTLRLPLGR